MDDHDLPPAIDSKAFILARYWYLEKLGWHGAAKEHRASVLRWPPVPGRLLSSFRTAVKAIEAEGMRIAPWEVRWKAYVDFLFAYFGRARHQPRIGHACSRNLLWKFRRRSATFLRGQPEPTRLNTRDTMIHYAKQLAAVYGLAPIDVPRKFPGLFPAGVAFVFVECR